MAKNYEYKKATIADIDELELSSFEQLTNYRMMWICHWWKKNPMSIISVH